MAKVCLYCGLQFPDMASFCPECGRLIETAIRVERGVKMKGMVGAKGCLYCGIELPETAAFCPECGRPLARGYRPLQEPRSSSLCEEGKGKDDHRRQPGVSSGCSNPLAPLQEYDLGHHPKCGARLAKCDRDHPSAFLAGAQKE